MKVPVQSKESRLLVVWCGSHSNHLHTSALRLRSICVLRGAMSSAYIDQRIVSGPIKQRPVSAASSAFPDSSTSTPSEDGEGTTTQTDFSRGTSTADGQSNNGPVRRAKAQNISMSAHADGQRVPAELQFAQPPSTRPTYVSRNKHIRVVIKVRGLQTLQLYPGMGPLPGAGNIRHAIQCWKDVSCKCHTI